ncbi:endonuclease/exonuclease/phosphatase family protein [Sphaerisporangium rufum]|uniref:endonuclease/exonuclease/phosphatase family protein n=1 Tax=Sphaerisporangium rufum TaxID=1381558 RepID=UPI00194F9A59|nr:endonuclease/exonuclease/phosphatase family protein [Sphaerisporangium rufum]
MIQITERAAGAALDVSADAWVGAGRGLVAAADLLAGEVDAYCAALADAGHCYGTDALGYAAAEGGPRTPGLRPVLDETLHELAGAVTALRRAGAGLAAGGHGYTAAESAVSAMLRGAPAGRPVPDGAGHLVVADYRPPVTGAGMVRAVPPPDGWRQAIALVQIVTVGCEWPDGDGDALRSARDAAGALAGTVRSVRADAARHAAEVLAGTGAATDRFGAVWQELDRRLDQLAVRCGEIAGRCEMIARTIDAARLQFGLTVVFVLVTLAAAPVAGIGEIALLRLVAVQGARLRAVLVAARQALLGAWLAMGSDAIGQWAHIHHGLRDGFDARELRAAGGYGALGGLVAGAGRGAVAALGRRFTPLAPLAPLMRESSAAGYAARFGVDGTSGTAAVLAGQAVSGESPDVLAAVRLGYGSALVNTAADAAVPVRGFVRGQDIEVSTWNIGGGRTIRSTGRFDYVPGENLTPFAEALAGGPHATPPGSRGTPAGGRAARVVILQESHVSRDGSGASIAEKLGTVLGLPHVAETRMCPSHIDPASDFALAVLADGPVTGHTVHKLPDPDFPLRINGAGDPVVPLNRSLQVAELAAGPGQGRVFVGNTHTCPLDYLGHPGGYESGPGVGHARDIERLLLEALPRDRPLLLAGDYNTDDLLRVYPELAKALHLREALEVPATVPWGGTPDHLLYSPAFRVREVAVTVPPTDHYLSRVTLHYRPWRQLLVRLFGR